MRKKPNLLFIFTDQQAAKTMKAYGNNGINTPNMDKLAEESIIFNNAYVTQPVCTPSRTSIMTGLYPSTAGTTENNIPLDPEIPCLVEMGDFKEYKTAYYGKWHLGDEVFKQHGFDDWRSIEDCYRYHYSESRNKNMHSDYYHFLVENGFTPDVKKDDGFEFFSRKYAGQIPEEYSKPAYLAREASNFIKENKDNPFILYVNFFEPHRPYISARDDQYNPDDVLLPENYYHELNEKNPLKTRLFKQAFYEKGQMGNPLKTDKDWQRIIARYWGLVSLVDTYLGQILETLNEYSLSKDTIIVYTSDHGDMMGSHRLLNKCVMFEEAVKVPLLIKIPGINCKGRSIDNPVSQIDLVPTLLDAMGQPIPEHLQGFSWMPFLRGEDSLKEENVFIEWNGYNSGFGGDVVNGANIPNYWYEYAKKDDILSALSDPVRTIITPDGWKYNYSSRGESELYNLNNDPYEMENLIDDPKYNRLIDELQKKLFSWQQRIERKI